jgi:hypothetical protein
MQKLVLLAVGLLLTPIGVLAEEKANTTMSLIENAFLELDQNQSGSVTKDEAKGIISSEDFTLADENKDKKLSKEEYIHFFTLKQQADPES